MFTNQLDSESGILLIHKHESRANTAIHMFFVGMDLGVIWLNSARKIVDIQLAKSWKPYYTPQAPASYILEINPVRLAEFEIGDQLDFE